MKYPHLAARLYNAPLLVHPEKATVIEQVFRAHLEGHAKPEANAADFERPHAAIGRVRFQNRNDRPYPITEGGVAVISVIGTLVQRADSLDAMSGLIGYNRLERQLLYAVDDYATKAILLEVDSPGGEANGCFDFAAKIIEARQAKPIWAHANEQAFSAAYAIACAAERLVMPQTGLVGSIGVIALHVDQSKRDASQGYAYTAVFAGDRKNDFTSHAPLSDTAKNVLQEEVDRLYGIFTSHVARARGIDDKAVRATEAGLLDPATAKAGGFVNDIASFGDTVIALEEKVRNTRSSFYPAAAAASNQEVPMKTNETAAATDTPAATATTQPAAVAPAAAAPAQPAAATPAPAVDAAAIEAAAKARAKGILGCEEAKGREQLAQHLAFESNVSVEDAKKTLAAAPKGTTGTSQFAAAMPANPKVGADAEQDGGEKKTSINTTSIYESRRQQAAERS